MRFFVTGTDTGVGKTLLTASLLHYLRQAGVNALAMKPFCSGGTGDVDLLQQIQGAEHPAEEINPFYFPEPVAPYVAARWQRRRIGMDSVLLAVRRLARQTDCLLIEGAGGLLVPLGRRFTAADLIAELRCEVIVVGPNKLGIINHVMLTVEALKRRGVGPPKVVLMAQKATDASASSNAETLAGILDPVEIFSVPFLGPKAAQDTLALFIREKHRRVIDKKIIKFPALQQFAQ